MRDLHAALDLVESKGFITVSAELKELSFGENSRRTTSFKTILEELALDFKEAEGCYNGVAETSFIVSPRNTDELDIVVNLAFKAYGQESVLLKTTGDNAYLMFINGNMTYLGLYTKVIDDGSFMNYTVVNGETFIVV